MLFRVLGPLEVRTGGGWTAVGAPKQRAVLAALLLARGQVVSAGRLVDELWGEQPPPGARKLVSKYVLQVRRLIGDPQGRMLVTRPPGYQLLTAPGDVDAECFEDLLAEGRKALGGDAQQAAKLLGDGLALWRGPALADVPGGALVAAEADRLDELRLVAVELRVEAELAGGAVTAGLAAELGVLVAEHPLRERLWHQLMRVLWEGGRPAEALEVYARARQVLAEELGADPGPGLQDLYQRILAGDQHVHFRDDAGDVRRAGQAGAADECPYPGLAAFGPAQAEWFSGRDELTADLVGRLNECLAEGGPLMVVAPSGAGKSSLLRAGLLPALTRGALPPAGSRRWPQLVFTPTAHPMREAAAQIAAIGSTPGGAGGPAVPDGDQLTVMVRSALRAHAEAGAAAARAVIVVDQLEELFTLCTDEQERRAFIGWLWQLAQPDTRDGPLALVVCGLRADFYAECANYPQLRRALQAGQTLVGPMSQAELREAILCPAEAAGLDVEAGLVELLLRDLGVTVSDGDRTPGTAGEYHAGRLPLLAHALQATWQQRCGNTLTVDGYLTTGGIQHAIATTAERAFSRLDPAGQHDARTLFLRLVKIGDDGEDVRRPVSRDGLLRGSRQPGTTRSVLDAYTRARLLTHTHDSVQITHEALIGAWPRLRQWIGQDRPGNLIRQELEQAAAAWDHDRGETSALYRGSRLEAARAWASNHELDLTPAARDFLAASRQQIRRATALRRSAVAALAALAMVASTAFVVAFLEGTTAARQRDQAIYTQATAEALQLSSSDTSLLGSSDTSLAAQLNLTAYRIHPAQDLTSRLLSTENSPLSTPLTARSGTVYSVAFSRDGRTLASGSADNTVRLWDEADPAHPQPLGQPLTGPKGTVYSVAFSRDGRTLASGSADNTVRLWDVADPAHPEALGQPLTGPTGAVYSVAFSPDGRTLASGSADNTVRLWDVADPAHPQPLGQPLTGPTGAVYSVAFSPDGRTLASGSADNTVRLWDVADPAHPRALGQPLTGHSGAVWSVAFSPDGRTLASGSDDNAVRLWDVADPAHPRALGHRLTGHTSDVWSVAFSPDGRTLASGSGDDTVRLWDVADPAHPQPLGQPLTGHAGAVESVAFSRDGRTLASGSADGTIRRWSLPQTVLTGPTNFIWSVAFSPDGRTLASGSGDNTVRLWNEADPAHPQPLGQPLTGPTGAVYSVAFSPDGRTLASGNADNTVRLWDEADPAHPQPLGQPLTGHTGAVESVAFSPDGRTLASGSADGTIRLWDVADPAHPQPLGQPLTGHTGAVWPVAFSPDGRTLASGSADGTIRLWDVADPAHPRPLGQPLTGPTGTVWSVAFSPDGRTLASGSGDNTVRLWNVADPAHPRALGQPLTGHTSDVWSVAFSPDGRTLASGSADNTVRLWNVADPAHPRALGQPLTGHTSAVYSVAFSPDGHTLASGSGDDTVWLWNLNVDYAIGRICAAARNDLTPQQWHKYIPQLPYQPPCGH